MSSSSHEGDRQSDRNSAGDGARHQGGVPSSALGKDLLDSVLRQTAQTTESTDAPTAADLSALRDVAARHRGKPLLLQPVVVELVEAVLVDQFKPMVNSAESWKAMCAGIAQTLFEDPVSRDRLHTLWTRLAEKAS